MSGAGRKSGYRKGVTQDVLYGEPVPEAGELIVQVQAMRGSNLFEIVTSDGETGVAMLPTKYRKLIWIRRGDFLIVAAAHGAHKGAVNYSVEHILYKDQIKHLKKENLWPESFNVDESMLDSKAGAGDDGTAASALGNLTLEKEAKRSDGLDVDNDPLLFVNRNRVGGRYIEEDDDDSDED
ncbi:hypothetical protein H310_02855 [Aphanomyces invadans]|uniref:S1-like domain-containing protein n=1 Tax=Aphanomyces invadans TaxID=157072 RepID=A0A024UM22_9STRA|nr:hypothetical protein H310_02855 [Aphanomyces invadans]ETW06673.1 hypothetical protein H310_02855 [Aphanomyces invadans]|eukprot:XP_008864748.1 hypothetical protein H310_02855 [Aphanomyces invadans]